MHDEYVKNVPCKVCGCTDLKLLEGYYYCIECGTQDATAREIVVGQINERDGNFVSTWSSKIKKVIPQEIKVCGEWHKWHCYNYILAGMADEVVSLGGSPSFKTKVLWLWSIYMKKYQDKRQLDTGLSNKDGDENDSSEELCKKKSKKSKAYDIGEMSRSLLFTILYVALNYDKSDIQLSDLIRFTQERRLSFVGYKKFVPKEIDLTLIDNYVSFKSGGHNPSAEYVLLYSAMFITTFDLGSPVIPDMKKIADRFVMELCLPDDFKHLVHSLMQFVSCDDLFFNRCNKNKPLPFYECEIMAYIIVGLKMCFGLDDDYEMKLSDVVDQINSENCHMKCHKLGVFSTFSDRLFSFRQWREFLKFRRLILSKMYWPMGQLFDMDVDDYVYMEQREHPSLTVRPTLKGEIILNILNKISEEGTVDVIPKSAFPPTLTPLTTYTNVVVEYLKDPELKLLLSEDFTKYSLKYACEKLDLRVTGDAENIVVGVESTRKSINRMGKSNMLPNQYDNSMVYVRNCENKNWMITNPPTLNHIINATEGNSHRENEVYDSPENKCLESDVGFSKSIEEFDKNVGNIAKTTELLQDESGNIFDDDFQNLEEYDEKCEKINIKTEPNDVSSPEINHDIENSIYNNDVDNNNIDNNVGDNTGQFFDSKTFNREETIRKLVLLTCKKYRIPIPLEFRTEEPKKNVRTRKTSTSEPRTKIARRSSSYVQTKVYEMLSAYRDKAGHGLLANSSEYNSIIDGFLHDNRNDVHSTEHNPCYQDNGNLGINTTFDQRADNESVVDPDLSVPLANNDGDAPDVNTQADLFDENIYNIKQLYLKVQEPNTEDDLDVSEDPEIDKLLTKKIDECIYAETNDMPVKTNFLKCSRLRGQNNSKQYKQLDYLIKNRKDIQKFNYWIRNPANIMTNYNFLAGMKRFKRELNEYFPKNFTFVLKECAAIVDCRLIMLYQSVVKLETAMVSRLKK